ncbi:MAG: twin-arginine translocase subunit TatC [Tepidisphaerales bacterium]
MRAAAEAQTSVRRSSVDETFDPESYRMTLGEHLEELRSRVIWGLLGFVVALAVCLVFVDRVVVFFCRPLIDALLAAGMNTQLFNSEVTKPFMLYVKVAVIVALVIAGPWMLFQLWLFVSAGLYPSERRVVRRYIPLSIALLVAGVLLAYYIVMPLTVRFLLAFNTAYGIGLNPGAALVDVPAEAVKTIPSLPGDPKDPLPGQMWHNLNDGRIKVFLSGRTVAINFAPDQLLAPVITMDTYVDLTMMMLLVFAVAFQLPLVVLALYKVGVLELEALKRSRRVVYFALAIAAAAISPGDVATAMLALYIPLLGLYEFAILLCWWSGRSETTEPA